MSTPPDKLKGCLVSTPKHTVGFGEIGTFLLPYLHVMDLLRLKQSCKKIEQLVGTDRFSRLEIHTVDSTDCPEDVVLSEALLAPHMVLPRAFQKVCRTVVLLNQTEIEQIDEKILRKVDAIFLKICQYNFQFFDSEKLLTLSLGFDSRFCIASSEVCGNMKFPNLKSLDLKAFPISSDFEENSFGDSSPFFLWLMQVLSSVRLLQWLRLNFALYTPKMKQKISDNKIEIFWKTRGIFFLEISFDKWFAGGSLVTEFLMLKSAEEPGFPSLHTLDLGARASTNVLRTLSSCKTLFHLVLSDFNLSAADWTEFGTLLKNSAETLQVMVLKILGKCDFHFDSFLHLILFHKVCQLDRFELQVCMDPQTGVMIAPLQTLTATTTFRCRFKSNTFFKRTSFGLVMSEEDFESEAATPMEFFGAEMIRALMEEEGPKMEANLYTEWNALPQHARASYVEIFEEYLEKGREKSQVGYCDLKATMAVLRE